MARGSERCFTASPAVVRPRWLLRITRPLGFLLEWPAIASIVTRTFLRQRFDINSGSNAKINSALFRTGRQRPALGLTTTDLLFHPRIAPSAPPNRLGPSVVSFARQQAVPA